jgi:AcrR family transcriptional regulator
MSEPKKPRRVSKQERRRHLLEHAKRAFLRHGYVGSLPANIAVAAGVSEAILVRHFPNKYDLFLEFLRELRQTTLERWLSATAELTDPLIKLHAITDMFLHAAASQTAEFRILHRALTEDCEEEVKAGVRAYYLDCEALLAQVIGEGQHSGVFRRNLDPRVGAWELIRSALGHTLTAALDVPLHKEGDYLARAVDCLFHALLKVDV